MATPNPLDPLMVDIVRIEVNDNRLERGVSQEQQALREEGKGTNTASCHKAVFA